MNTTADDDEDDDDALPRDPEIDALAAAVRAAITGQGTPATDPLRAAETLRASMEAGSQPALFALFELGMLQEDLRRQRRRGRRVAKR